MTELEIIQHAKMYIDKMANGIDPLSDKALPDGDCLNQVRVSRCLFFVSDVLDRLIRRGGFKEKKEQKPAKAPFALTPSQKAGFRFSEIPYTVTVLTERLNELIDQTVMQKIKYKAITRYLMREKYIELVPFEGANNGFSKSATEKGREVGITSEVRTSSSGNRYLYVYYGIRAQRFILDHIEEIVRDEARGDVPSEEGTTGEALPDEAGGDA